MNHREEQTVVLFLVMVGWILDYESDAKGLSIYHMDMPTLPCGITSIHVVLGFIHHCLQVVQLVVSSFRDLCP